MEDDLETIFIDWSQEWSQQAPEAQAREKEINQEKNPRKDKQGREADKSKSNFPPEEPTLKMQKQQGEKDAAK